MTAAGAARYDATPMRDHHPARHSSRPKGLRSLITPAFEDIANATKITPKRNRLDNQSFSSGVVKCFPCGAVRPSLAHFDTERRFRDAGETRPPTMNNERMPLTTDRDGDPPSNQLDDSRDQDDRDDHPNNAGDAPLSKLREIFFIFFSELRSRTRKTGSESKTGGRSHERSEWLQPLRQQWGEGVQTPSPPSPLLVERVEELRLHLSTVSGEEVPGGGRHE